MRRYLLHSALLHFALLGLFIMISLLAPPAPIWFDGVGFDIYGPGSGFGPGGGEGAKGDGKIASTALKQEKRGQPVPQPENIKIPDKPSPVQKETRTEEKWKIKDQKSTSKKASEAPSDREQDVRRGKKEQKAQTNIIRRGVREGSVAGEGEFDFNGTGTGAGTGKGIGIGFGPGGGGGGAGMGGYLAAMRRKIWNEWIQYATFGSDKSCVVGLVVMKNGYVHSVKLVKSSGDSLFDMHAQKAIRNAQPLPPLPPAFPRAEQEFRLKFRLLE